MTRERDCAHHQLCVDGYLLQTHHSYLFIGHFKFEFNSRNFLKFNFWIHFFCHTIKFSILNVLFYASVFLGIWQR